MQKKSKCEEIVIAPWINSHQRSDGAEKDYAICVHSEPEQVNDASCQQVTASSWKIKAIAVAALIVTAFGVGMWLCNGYIYPAEQVKPKRPEVHTVEPGDTLWSVASKYSDDSQDVREIYYRIMQDNRIGFADQLQPGQRLIIKF